MAPAVSLDGLHRILWQMRYSNGTVRVVQAELAKDIDVTKFTVNRLLVRMEDEQRLKKVSGRRNVNTYLVADPATWEKP